MLAEIFMLRLEALARETPADKPTMALSKTRFVPISPPRSQPVQPSPEIGSAGREPWPAVH